RLTEKAGDFLPALEPFVLNPRLSCGRTFLGWLFVLLHGDRIQSKRIENRVHSSPGCRTPRKYEPGGTRPRSTSALRTTIWSSSLAVALVRKSSAPLGLSR